MRTKPITATILAVAVLALAVAPGAAAKRHKPIGHFITASNGAMFFVFDKKPKPTKPGATIDGHGLGRTPWHPAGYVLVLP